ncbi:MAG: hypothetical protein IPH78_00305 [Bacteroidetes bacterium]|nr:hypothetical protein [Bacteroidota bacterium]MBK8659997.1 hypothetical protein [Bacteroidota bacterium]
MKTPIKIFLLMTALFLAQVAAASTAADSSGSDIFEIERKAEIQRINFEKTRIANDFKSADARLFNLIDSLVRFVEELPVSKSRRNVYLKRLEVYLTNIDRYYSDSYLKNGTYLAVLSYYPTLIDWDQKDELLRNLKRYSTFSIKAIRLVPSDTVAEEFLTDYLNEHPDETFRYAEEFDDRPFATTLLDKSLRLAPESAKRYFTNVNPVNVLLSKSRDPYVKASYAIYNQYGIRSRAYLLLDAIVKEKMSIETADSLGNHPNQMFTELVARSMRYDANVTYSIYRYMDIYCIDAMRKINQSALDPAYAFTDFTGYSSEEMFVLISYGFRETTERALQKMLVLLRQKSSAIPVSSAMIASLDKAKLKDLVIYCDRNHLLSELLALVDDEKKDYMLALTTIEERENYFPPFKTFVRESALTNTDPVDLSMNEITKAKPTAPLSPDTLSEMMPVKPEKEKITEAAPPSSSATVSVADVVPVPLPEPEPVIPPIQISLDERTKAVMLLKKNVLQSLQRIPEFIDKPYAEEFLLYAAEKEPDELFKRVELFKSKFFVKKVLDKCAFNAPVSVKRYLYNPHHPVNFILQYSTDPVVKKILEINPQLGYHSKPLLLLEEIAAGKYTAAQAVQISTDPLKLFAAVTDIISKPNYVGRYSIDHEMRDYSLRFVREINDKIASGSSQPFYTVEGFNATQLYFLMLYGRDEVFASTFNGLFNRFLQKIPAQNGKSFLQSVNYNRFRDFMSLCSSYDLLEQLLLKFDDASKKELVYRYISDLEKAQDDLTTIVLIAETVSNLRDAELLSAIEKNIRKEYERVSLDSNQVGISIYGVLSSIISDKARSETKWYKQVSRQFEVTPAGSLSIAALFAGGNICVEQMYFYNDDDGRSSYINFLNTYKNQPNWVVEDKSSFVRIYSVTGKQVEIFANKPDYEENGSTAIAAYLAERKIYPSVIVHRGHSFHTESTLEKVPATAKLIFVGSCGGFYKLSMAIENAPDAHLIATRQVGTKTINDVMIFALNENIREGRDIIWNDFWQKMETRLGSNQYFGDYIPPNKNLESIFIKAYYKILGV